MDTIGGRRGGMDNKSSIETYTLSYLADSQWEAVVSHRDTARCSVMTKGVGWRSGGERHKREDTHTHTHTLKIHAK